MANDVVGISDELAAGMIEASENASRVLWKMAVHGMVPFSYWAEAISASDDLRATLRREFDINC